MKNNKNNSVSEDVVVDIRQSMSKLPTIFQWLLTWLTGKALPGQQPLIKRSNLSHVFTAYLMFFFGIALSAYSFNIGLWLFMPAGWLFTVSSARKMIVMLNHYSVHRCLLPPSLRTRFGWLQPYIADFNSSFLFLQSYKDYAKEHLTHHGDKIVASIIDPDMAFMWELGFKPGMTRAQLWRVLLYNLFVPFSKLHRLFIVSRVKTTFLKGNKLRYVVQGCVVLTLAIICYFTSMSMVFWIWLFPMTYLYHMASLLQFSCEHFWLQGVESNGRLSMANNRKELRARALRLTQARFCGQAAPASNHNIFLYTIAWVKWIVAMCFVHLPIRLFVLPGDLPVHDHHHMGMMDEWANAFYSRANAVADMQNNAPYAEVWGLKNAINKVFEGLSKMDPIYPNASDIDKDAVLGM